MGFARRVVRKSVRRATPRPVRKAMHPARTARNAITPRPVKQVRRAVYTTRHPIGAAENKAIGAVLYPPRPRRRRRGSSGAGCLGVGLVAFTMIGLLAVIPWWTILGVALVAGVIVIGNRRKPSRSITPPPDPPSAWPYGSPPGGSTTPTPPQFPPEPLPKPPAGSPPRVQPWPHNRAFRTPPPDITPPERPVMPPTSAGDWELDARRRTGFGDGSRN